jgi:glycosyltransferase involved in cell wall biosynthesis
MRKKKIFLCDQPIHKTTSILKRHWEENHELVCDPYFNPFKAQWADVTWIEWCEGSMIHASERESDGSQEWTKGGYNDFDDPSHRTPIDFIGNWNNTKLINRAIDIDVWFAQYPQVKWENVNGLTYVAKHIFEMMDKRMDFQNRYPKLQIKHIPLSIDFEAWSFKDRTKTHGKNIAFINHLWSGKGIPLALQILAKLVALDKEWKLWLVGDWSNEPWFRGYIDYIIKEMGLDENVIIQYRVVDVNSFLDNMDYSLSTSYKESFSLITAESMAKGLKPVIHNWQGSRDVWGEQWVYNTIDEAVNMFLDNYNSNEYREFVSRYDKKYEIQKSDELINELCAS